jgi:hypothetical protein
MSTPIGAEIVPVLIREKIERLDGLHEAGCHRSPRSSSPGGQLGECPEYDVTTPDIGIRLGG